MIGQACVLVWILAAAGPTASDYAFETSEFMKQTAHRDRARSRTTPRHRVPAAR